MELTRRDALYSFLAGGSAAVASTSVPTALLAGSQDEGPVVDAATVETLVGVAEVVYPSAVSEIPAFVSRYISGLSGPHQRAVASAVDALAAYAHRVTGKSFTELSVEQRDAVLRTMGVGRAVATQAGPVPARIRYYVVDQLLCGLYTSPKGSRLVGIENPVGHPGGYDSYQMPPNQSRRSGVDVR